MLSFQLQESESGMRDTSRRKPFKSQHSDQALLLLEIQKMSLLLQAYLHHGGIALLGSAEEVAAEPSCEHPQEQIIPSGAHCPARQQARC